MAFKRQSRLQAYLASQYVEFDPENPSQRLNSLYSEFSKIATVNPYAYNLNVAYWRSVILDCNLQGLLGCTDYKLVIHANDVSDAFMRPGLGKPISLDCVLKQMLQNGDIMRMEDFAYAYTSPTMSWLSWMSGRFRRWLPGSEQQLFVVMPTVKALARQIIESRNRQKMAGPSDHLYTFSEFREKYGRLGETEMTDGDLWLLIRYMTAEFGVAVADHVQGYGASYVAIKFPEKSELETRRAYITQQDKAIISIRTTCHALQVQVDHLQAKSEELLASSKEHYTGRRKPQALYALKRKKNIEEILARRLRSLETMETMLMKIEASQNDLQVVQAFNMGADALRNILQKDDLSIAMVDEALLKVQRAFEDQREVEDAIAQRVEETNQSQVPPDFDEEALTKELEDLEAQAGSPPSNIRESSPPIPMSEPPPPRQETVSAPLPSQSESELVRLDQIVASLRQAGQPPTKIPSSGSSYKDMEPAM